MKSTEKLEAISLRSKGLSINEISRSLGVSKSSVSTWVRHVNLSSDQVFALAGKPFTSDAIEKRRKSRLANEESKRKAVVFSAKLDIPKSLSLEQLHLMGVMLYWAEGGKTQRMVRFSNGDPKMITIMMKFFKLVCKVPDAKFRGYIHIHPHLDVESAELYWSKVSGINRSQFFKTYNKINKGSKGKKDTLPHGVLDIYVLDTKLFLKIKGWADGIFDANFRDAF